MRKDATTPLEKELLDALAHLLCNVEEDVPLILAAVLVLVLRDILAEIE